MTTLSQELPGLVEDYLKQVEQHSDVRGRRPTINDASMTASQYQKMDEDQGLTETQKAMKKMKANMSVINNVAEVAPPRTRDSPLKSRRLSIGASSRVSTPQRLGTPG